MKTLLVASLLVPGLALADMSHTSSTYPQPRTMQQGSVNTMEGPYGRIEGGVFWPNKVKYSGVYSGKAKSKNSWGAGLGGGYVFNEFAKTDLLLNYRDLRARQYGRVNVWSAMWNGYLGLHNSSILTPFALGGIGLGYLQSKPSLPVPSKGKDTTQFVWNVGAGVSAKVDESMSVDLTYRYLDVGKSKATITNQGSVKTKHMTANEVVLGLGYQF